MQVLYATFYLMALALGGSGAWVIGKSGHRFGLIDRPNERSSHQSLTPRGGGIGILAAFLFTSLFFEIPWLFWMPAALLALLSFFSDKLEPSVKLRLAFQFLAAIVLLVGMGHLHLSDASEMVLIIFLAVFAAGTANIYNFMDGINGIAAITGIIGFGLLSLSNFLSGGDNPFTVLSLCIAMSCLGFLPFNMPKAKVFMGDVGSILLGFVFAGLTVKVSNNFLDFVCLTSFLFPFYADELSTMAVRIKDGENLLRAHRRHLYQLLANEKGIPHWKISAGYGALQLAVGISVLLVKPFGLFPILTLVAGYFAAFTIVSTVVRRKVAELESSQKST